VHENFFLMDGEPCEIYWSQVRWLGVERLEAPSIGAAAKSLRRLAKRWVMVPGLNHRRATLIAEQLRAYAPGPLEFPGRPNLPEATGAFALLSPGEIYWSRSFDRPHPLGLCDFAESDLAPSRAYLKLWEALALRGEWPAAGERCLDLGASPGGWTWALARLGAAVLSVDRASLDPRVAALPRVEFRAGDAFQVEPSPEFRWLFSDVICYPEKLQAYVENWLAVVPDLRFVCTLKFQGDADPALVDRCARLGRVLHLAHNKHELTWMR
jgi:23S rRNA (cytidine2498-2'-O)-methyltransferase